MKHMEKSISQKLAEAIEKALDIAIAHWDEVQEDENCSQAFEVLQMLYDSLAED